MPELAVTEAAIPLLVPDMPPAAALLPWFERIDAARWYANFGPLAGEFEAYLAQACAGVDAGVYANSGADADTLSPPDVVSLNSGTAALELGVAALDLPAGSTVLLPAFTFPATASAPLRQGLLPLLADVDPDSWQLTPALARQAARRHPVALVMPVATFGCPVDVAGWQAFSMETGIPVLIDAAAAFGNQAVGAGIAVAFSFHATKPFGIGEGGALAMRDAALAARVRRLSNFGFEGGLVTRAGCNAKLSEYAAAVGLAQKLRWPARQARRHRLWQVYAAALAAVPGVALQHGFNGHALPATLGVRLPLPAPRVAAALARAGIETRRWYCPPLHHHPAFAGYRRCGPDGTDALAVTEHLALYCLGLPWFAGMEEAQCLAVAQALSEALAGAGETCRERAPCRSAR